METSPDSKYPTYTSGKFWGGTVVPFWVFMLFTAFPLTGLLGLDHLLFRSPSTALLKGITNIFTLGLWYIYDMVQVFSDKQFVKDYGLSKPMVGPAGLALDYFSGVQGKDALPASKSGVSSILLFVMYLFSLFIPFGISNFVAGDIEGGIAKFLFSFGLWGIIWIPFFFIASFFELYRGIFDTEKVFTEGAIRPTPITFLMSGNGYSPNIMNPSTIDKEKSREGFSFYSTFVKPLLSFFGIKDPAEVLDTAKCQVVPPVEKTVKAATVAAAGVQKLAGAVPEIAAEASAKLATFTDPAKLQEAAQKAAMARIQTGGGITGNGTSPLDYIFVGGLGFLIIGGLFAAFLRKSLNRKDGGQERDDRPSQPHLL